MSEKFDTIFIGRLNGYLEVVDLLDNLAWFKSAPDWTAWRSFLCAVYGLPMTPNELEIYRACTGRHDPPTKKAREVWVPTGRRARKSAIAALIGVYEGCFRDFTPYLAPGERAVIPVIAKDKYEAGQIRNYVLAILADPSLREFLAVDPNKVGSENIPLVTGVDIAIRARSLTAGRSRATPCALLDEVAFFPAEDSATPDEDVVKGILPAMANMPEPLLVGLSSPWWCRGVLWRKTQDHYGKDGPVLVWKAPTLTMHDTPLIREAVETAYASDPIAAAAEYGGEFREDVAAYFSQTLWNALVVEDRKQREPIAVDDIRKGLVKPVNYWAFVDVSGGGQDPFALAIAHWERDRVVLDLAWQTRSGSREFWLEQTVGEVVQILRKYRIEFVKGDKYGGRWPSERFAASGIGYERSKLPKNDIFREAIPIFTSRAVELLDLPELRDQLLSLKRRVTTAGQEIISRDNGHDDLANAVVGAVLEAYEGRHKEAEQPAEPLPQTLEELRAKQLREVWAEVNKPAEPIGRGALLR